MSESRLAHFYLRTCFALIASLLWQSRPAQAQDDADPLGTWLIRRATADDLVLRVTLTESRGTLQAIGAFGRWTAAPAEVTEGRGPVTVGVAASDGRTAILSLDAWHASLVLMSDGLALWLPDGADEIGLAYRERPVPTAFIGEWQRTELHPTGPRIRRLRLGPDSALSWDSRGRPTELGARGLVANEPEAALALLPEGHSGVAVRLVPVGAAWIGLERGGDEVTVVFAEGTRPPWIDASAPGPDTADPGGVIGRWLVGRGEGDRLTAMLTSSVSGATWTQLGPGTDEPATLSLGAPGEPGWLTVDDEAPQRLWLAGPTDGLLWPSDENRYSTLWAVQGVADELQGTWSIDGRDGPRVVLITADALREGRRALPLVGLSGRDGALGAATLEDDRAGRRLRWWPLGPNELVDEAGAHWTRLASEPAAP